jgi:hypothetical protein
MKKLIVLFLLFAFATNAQIIFKTQPNSLITVDFSSYRIDGVSGRVVEMPLNLSDSIAFTVYLEFYRADASGNLVTIPRSGMNADRVDFTKGVSAGLAANATAAMVKNAVNNVMKAMLTGSPIEKWAAYNAIMSGYGAALLPLSGQ